MSINLFKIITNPLYVIMAHVFYKNNFIFQNKRNRRDLHFCKSLQCLFNVKQLDFISASVFSLL